MNVRVRSGNGLQTSLSSRRMHILEAQTGRFKLRFLTIVVSIRVVVYIHYARKKPLVQALVAYARYSNGRMRAGRWGLVYRARCDLRQAPQHVHLYHQLQGPVEHLDSQPGGLHS